MIFARRCACRPHGDEIVPLINRLLQLPFDVIVASRDLHPIKHMSFASTWEKKVGERIIVAVMKGKL